MVQSTRESGSLESPKETIVTIKKNIVYGVDESVRKCPGKRIALVASTSEHIVNLCCIDRVCRLCKHHAAATGSDEDKTIREEGGALGSASDTSHAFPCPDHLAFDVFGTRSAGLSCWSDLHIQRIRGVKQGIARGCGSVHCKKDGTRVQRNLCCQYVTDDERIE